MHILSPETDNCSLNEMLPSLGRNKKKIYSSRSSSFFTNLCLIEPSVSGKSYSTWLLSHCILNRPSHSIYEESNFNFRYVRLWDLHIPTEKWLNYLQTVETLIRRRVLRRLIWVCTVCQLPFYGSPDYNGLMWDNRGGSKRISEGVRFTHTVKPQQLEHRWLIYHG